VPTAARRFPWARRPILAAAHRGRARCALRPSPPLPKLTGGAVKFYKVTSAQLIKAN